MTSDLKNIKDIELMLLSLKPEEITRIMSGVTINKMAYKIDYSIRARRNQRTELYFSAEPKPHQLIKDKPMSPEEYRGHRQGVWEQVICQ